MKEEAGRGNLEGVAWSWEGRPCQDRWWDLEYGGDIGKRMKRYFEDHYECDTNCFLSWPLGWSCELYHNMMGGQVVGEIPSSTHLSSVWQVFIKGSPWALVGDCHLLKGGSCSPLFPVLQVRRGQVHWQQHIYFVFSVFSSISLSVWKCEWLTVLDNFNVWNV